MRVSRMLLSAIALAVATSGCSCSDDSGDDPPTDTATCTAETFSAGMTKPGDAGKLTFVLVSSDPAPPARYYNTWIVEVREGDAPLAGATIVVEATMPAHQHPPENVSVTDQGAGRYELTPLNLAMPGLWQIVVTATTATGTTDSVTFKFCIVG